MSGAEHFDPHQEWTERCRDLAKADVEAQSAIAIRQFAIGDLLTEGEDKWSRDIYDEAASIFTGYAKVTLRDFASVARSVKASSRNDVLSWAHHKAVSRLDDSDQRKFLARAVADKMSVSTLRRHIAEEHPSEKPTAKNGKLRSITLSLPTDLMEFIKSYARAHKVTPERAVFSMIDMAREQEREAEEVAA